MLLQVWRCTLIGIMLLSIFREKWNPVFRPKMRPQKKIKQLLFPWKQKRFRQ
jgi:hypothetical protein